MILRIKDILLISSDNNNGVVTLFRESNINFIVVHNASDVFAPETDEPPVNSRINIDLFAALVVLQNNKL